LRRWRRSSNLNRDSSQREANVSSWPVAPVAVYSSTPPLLRGKPQYGIHRTIWSASRGSAVVPGFGAIRSSDPERTQRNETKQLTQSESLSPWPWMLFDRFSPEPTPVGGSKVARMDPTCRVPCWPRCFPNAICAGYQRTINEMLTNTSFLSAINVVGTAANNNKGASLMETTFAALAVLTSYDLYTLCFTILMFAGVCCCVFCRCDDR